MATIPKIAKVAPQSSALFICDIQERFKGVIWQYPSVITVASKMVIRHQPVHFVHDTNMDFIDQGKQDSGYPCYCHRAVSKG